MTTSTTSALTPETSVAEAGRWRSCAATHPGAVRTTNQDRFVNRPDLGLWAVADGAGGHLDGGRAAGLIAAALNAVAPGLGAGEVLSDARRRVLEAHAELVAEAADGPGLVASTVVVLLIRSDHFACLWAGDSRAYLMRAGTLHRVTRDHSVVQELVDAGAIAAADAESHPNANVITRAVGAGEALLLDKVSDRVAPGDRFLLCSDGLFKALDEARIAELVAVEDAAAAERLILAALEAQATDNVTAVTVSVVAKSADPDATVS
jgi:protein phosphatase/serine/threonine-protein phosphatase Stp1